MGRKFNGVGLPGVLMSFGVNHLSSLMLNAYEAIGFHSYILKAVEENREVDLGPTLKTYAESVKNMVNTLKISRDEPSEIKIQKELDKRRIAAYYGAVNYLNAMLRCPDPAIAKAAAHIRTVCRRKEDVRHSESLALCGIFDLMISDLSLIDNSVMDLASFGVWFKELKESQKAYLDFIHKICDEVPKDKQSFKQAKIECDDAYKAFIKHLNYMAEVFSDNESIAQLVNELNMVMDKIREDKPFRSREP